MKPQDNCILLVEDDPDHAELIIDSFAEAGLGEFVRVVRTVADARDYLSRSTPELVIADWHLPDGRGRELLPGDRESARYPVIVLTGSGDERLAAEVMRSGALDYLPKSVESFQELPNVARRAIQTWDIFARRRDERLASAQTQLRESDEQKMEAIGRLAGGVAHDFNNLLTVICAKAELAQGYPGLPADLQGAIDSIARSAQHAAGLTQQLLAFSRKQLLEMKEVDVNGLLSNLHRLLQCIASQKVEVKIDCQPGLGMVLADAAKLEQAVTNLCVNAVQAMPDGGTLRVETASVNLTREQVGDLSALSPGPHVVIRVSDTGCGMSEEVQRHVFEPFYTTRQVGQGPGLGLATVYGITKQHGGDIRLRSALGKGSTFEILLPVVPGQYRPAPAKPETDEIRSEGRTILVVEDNPDVREVAVDILTSHGYDVIDAGGPVQALELARSRCGPVDLVVTDLIMPDMTGKEMADVIQAEVWPNVSVLYMSGYSSEVVAREGRLPRDVNFLHKPFTLQGLVAAVQRAMPARNRAPSAE